MKLTIKKTFVVLTTICMLLTPAIVSGVTLNVPTAGTLEQVIDDCNEPSFQTLKIVGYLNAEDIKYIRTGADRLGSIETLDLSDVKLVSGDTYYATIGFGGGDADLFSSTTYYFYISDKPHIEETATVGFAYKTVYRYYSNQLEGAFANMKYKKVVLPKSQKGIGIYTFYECEDLTSVASDNPIDSIGEGAFSGCKNLANIDLSNATQIGNNAFCDCSVLNNIDLSNVTQIGQNAFNNCSSLATVTIPASVAGVNGNTFYGTPFYNNLPAENNIVYLNTIAIRCNNRDVTSLIFREGTTEIASKFFYSTEENKLENVYCPSSLKRIGEHAFYGCSGLTSVTLSEGLEEIGEYAFANCSKLTSVTIPNSVTAIGNRVFSDCKGLTSVTIGNSVTEIGEDAFSFCSSLRSVIIPNSVTSIGNSAFWGCSKLTSVTIPNSVTEIGKSAFYNCSGLTSVTIGNSVTSIEESAFAGCSNLTSVTIPNSVTSIGSNAFSGCSNLTSVSIGNSVTSIGSNAFSGCSGLTSISVESGNTKYDSRDNCNAIIETASNTLIKGGNNTVIPNSVKTIGNSAFYGSTGLTSIEIPNSVTSIRDGAFYGCTGLTSISVESGNTIYDSRDNCNAIIETASNTLITGCKNTTIPNSVTAIGYSAFYGCTGLTSLTIPNSVTSIGNSAFYGCSSLTDVICEATSVPKSNVRRLFDGVPLSIATLYVPAAALSDYKAAYYWRDFGTIKTIEESIPEVYISGKCGENVNYVLSKDYTLTISGTGAMYDYDYNTQPWNEYSSKMKSIIIENGVTNIGAFAFFTCQISSIKIAESVTSIGKQAFSYCSKLNSISLPENLASIDHYAFSDCSALTSIKCMAKKVPTTGLDVFLDAPQSTATLYIPSSAVDSYKAVSPWKDFGTITPMGDDNIYIETDVTANFPTDWQGWNGATGYTATQFAPMVTTNDGRTVQVCERYNGSSAATGTVFKRTLTGLTNGTYRIELYGAASSTKGRDTSISSDMTASNEGDETAVYLYATTPSGTVKQYIPVHWATSFSEVATAVLNGVEVTDGTIEIGMYSEKKFTNWHVVQIKGVTALVDAKVRHTDVLQTAQASLADGAYTNIVGEERTALAQTIRQYSTVTEQTAEAYQTAVNALVSATSAFTNAKVSYDEWAYFKNLSFPYASAEKKAAAETAAAANPTNAADAVSKAESLTTLFRSYAESSALLEGVEGSENVTGTYIQNPKAEEGYSSTGWKVFWGEGSPVGGISIKTEQSWTDASGNSSHKYFDGGYWGASSWDATQMQEVTLPAGHYQLTVLGRSSEGVEQTLFAGDKTIEMPHIGNTGGLFNRGWEQTSMEFELAETTTMNIGVRGVTNARQNWMSFSDFRLVRFPDVKKCATPTINFADGKLQFTCETEGVEFVSKVTLKDSDEGEYEGSSIPLATTYTVTVYATKEGYLDSGVATKDINVVGIGGLRGDVNLDGEVGMPDVMFIVNYILNGKFPEE